MEALEEPKLSLLDAVHTQLAAFDRTLKEQLDLRNAAFAIERKAFQEEIKTLKEQLCGIKELELENNVLRSRLEGIGTTSKSKALEVDAGAPRAGGCNETHVPDAPSLDEYMRVVNANTTLKVRLAKARKLNQQWSLFYRFTGMVSEDGKSSSLKEYCLDCLASKMRESEDMKSSILNKVSPVQAPIDRDLLSPKSLSYGSITGFSSKVGPEPCSQQEPALHGLPSYTIAAENYGPLQDPHENHTSSETDDPSEDGEDSQNQPNPQSEITLERVKADEDSESPIIISERSLRRKRKPSRRLGNPDNPGDTQAQQGTMKKPVLVKSDPNSSSPSTHVFHSTPTNPQDSMDLDEVGERHFTPRKRRRMLDEELRRVSGLEIPTEAHNAEEFQDQTLVADTDEEADCEELPDLKTQDRRHDFEVVNESRITSRINPAEGPQPILGKPKESMLAPYSILKPKDPNVQPLSSKKSYLKDLNRPVFQSQRSTVSNAPAFQDERKDFSQAGDRLSLKEEINTAKSHKAHRAIKNHQPLKHISSEHSTRKGLIDSVAVANSKQAMRDPNGQGNSTKTCSRSMTEKHHIPGSSILRPNAVISRRSYHVPSDEPDDPDKTLVEQEPLRSKPRKFLRPEDFKINPVHNHGYAHPVSEVVRNRDQRSCLPGCTRPNCCGTAIRSIVAMGGHFPAPKNSVFSKDIPLDHDPDDDERCLQAYLGDDYPRLKYLPWEDKEELLWAARTEQFANAYGKHRYQYGRQQTPPGFWDADMPSTQQEIKNKTIAKAMQKAKVAERHREAMRPGGRYRFRDE